MSLLPAAPSFNAASGAHTSGEAAIVATFETIPGCRRYADEDERKAGGGGGGPQIKSKRRARSRDKVGWAARFRRLHSQPFASFSAEAAAAPQNVC